MVLSVLSLRRSLSVLVAVAAIAAVTLTWMRVARALVDAKPPPVKLQATSIVWAGRVFQGPGQLASWLRSRGGDYAAWRAAHPVDAALLERRPPPAPTKDPAPARPKAPAPTKARSAAPRSAASTTSAGLPLRKTLVAILALLALLCIGAASLPALLRERAPAVAFAVASHRDLLLGAAVAIMIGIVAATS